MSTALLSLVMDLAVMAALAGTIYYTMRLSNSLKNFRAQRNEMKNLIIELSKNIDEAQDAIQGLRAMSNKAADNLEGVLHDAQIMADELKVMTQSADKLSARLETQIDRGRNTKAPVREEYFDEPEPANQAKKEPANIDAPSFFIKDREFEEEGAEGFSSQAEKDLYEALQENKKSGKGRK